MEYSRCYVAYKRTRIGQGVRVSVLSFALLVLCQLLGCSNEAGVSPDIPGPSKVKLTFPVTVGSTWSFSHTYSYGPHAPHAGIYDTRNGVREWRIDSMITAHDTTTCVIMVTGSDDVHQREVTIGMPDRDTIFTVNVASRFTVVTFPDTIVTNFGFSSPYHIPRTLVNKADTVQVGLPNGYMKYTDGIGLILHSEGQTSMSGTYYQYYVLIGNSIK